MVELGLAKAAPIALRMAGLSLNDIDVAEIYDCFTYIVICQLEDLGFCKKGEGGDFVSSGNIKKMEPSQLIPMEAFYLKLTSLV